LDYEHWSRVAAEWVAWARTPNHYAFCAYRAELLAFIGRGDGEALDVGCGEVRVSRAHRTIQSWTFRSLTATSRAMPFAVYHWAGAYVGDELGPTRFVAATYWSHYATNPITTRADSRIRPARHPCPDSDAGIAGKRHARSNGPRPPYPFRGSARMANRGSRVY